MRLFRPLLFSLTFLASTVFTHDIDPGEPVLSPVKHHYQASFTTDCETLELESILTLYLIQSDVARLRKIVINR